MENESLITLKTIKFQFYFFDSNNDAVIVRKSLKERNY